MSRVNNKIAITVTAILCIYLDCILFSRIHFMDIRPDALMAATISFAVLSGSFPGALFGCICGLLLDIFAGRFVGLSAALYLLAGLTGGFFYRKFYADNIIVPAATAVGCALGKELCLALVAFLAGARYAFGAIFLRVVLPGALCTGVLCILFHLLLKPILASQVKRGPTERLSMKEQLPTHTGKDTLP